MRRLMTLAALAALLFSASNVYASDANTHLVLRGGYGTPSSYTGMLSDNYDGDDCRHGFVGLGITESYRGELGAMAAIGFNYSQSTYNYSGNVPDGTDNSAKWSALHFVIDATYPVTQGERASLNLVRGVGVGGARFTMSDDLATALNGNTMTELGNEDGDTQYSMSFVRGAQFQFGSLGLSYNHMWGLAPEHYKFWHNALSGTVQQFVLAIPWSVLTELGETGTAGYVAAFALDTALIHFWNQWSADHWHWPYDEANAMQFTSHRIGATLRFP